jgi:hypothetical protein
MSTGRSALAVSGFYWLPGGSGCRFRRGASSITTSSSLITMGIVYLLNLFGLTFTS